MLILCVCASMYIKVVCNCVSESASLKEGEIRSEDDMCGVNSNNFGFGVVTDFILHDVI